MIRLVSWNIGKRAAPWHCLAKMAERGQADVALLQEAGNPPDGLEYPLRYEDGVFRDRSCYDRWPLVVQLSDRVGASRWTGYTPLMWATSAEATRTPVYAGASGHARDRDGHTPLKWAISRNNVPDEAARIANELIDAGADVKARDNRGQTSLYWARRQRDRLPEPRLRKIAEELVSILRAASDARFSAGTAGSGRGDSVDKAD